jgi:UPF0755 protein
MIKRFVLLLVAAFCIGLLSYGGFSLMHKISPPAPYITDTQGALPSGNIHTTPATQEDTPASTDQPAQGDAPASTPSTPTATTTESVPPQETADPTLERFIVPLSATTSAQLAAKLKAEGFISSETAFSLAYSARGGGAVIPGGYKISKKMNSIQLAGIFHQAPYMKWITIPEGLRKEEIAAILAKNLGWTDAQRQAWITTYTTMKFDYREGTYFPETYLIPVDEAPLDVANRLIAKFNEKFNPYLPEFNAQNIKWTTGLTFASIVQREAASKADMALIAGILWNRLDNNMYLGVDATLQYARGNTGSGWWAPISVADKQLASPFNTYTNKGLPPRPIANPGLTAIEATLHPEKTNCLYYLHDKQKQIRCAVTYEEHQANVQKYLVDAQ